MPRSFDPSYEVSEGKKFRTLASLFQRPETFWLGDRFSMLAVLSEEKAKILVELDEAIAVHNEEHGTARRRNLIG